MATDIPWLIADDCIYLMSEDVRSTAENSNTSIYISKRVFLSSSADFDIVDGRLISIGAR
jgi:hypothetical protein